MSEMYEYMKSSKTTNSTPDKTFQLDFLKKNTA